MEVFGAGNGQKTTMPNLEYALPVKSGDLAQMKVRATGLLVACPHSQDNPYDCPLHAVRERPLRERYHWLESLQPGQLKKLLDQHSECILRKEQMDREPA